jgi:hypothetical protein
MTEYTKNTRHRFESEISPMSVNTEIRLLSGAA